tara:strand:+ start:182 stop:931 length:750 start_codon:yes stop_codon:yes gene_type:complete
MSEAVLKIADITKKFGALVATDAVSLEVRKGEIHALIGPNGAGKTTLISQIFGDLVPDSGSIFLNRQDITKLSVAERANNGIGRSFQISNVISDFTVLENAIVAEISKSKTGTKFFAPAFHDHKLIVAGKEILSRTNIEHLAKRKVADIGHGERRLLELALALSSDPTLVLLDEPMAGAGPAETKFMTKVIGKLRKKTSVLLIEHDMDVVFQLADRISVLVEGEIVASGSPDQISQNKKVQEAYLGSTR